MCRLRNLQARARIEAAAALLPPSLNTMKRPVATRQTAPRRPAAARVAVPAGAAAAPRNPVALALAARRQSGAAGRHRRSPGAQRRADRVTLQKALE